MPVGSHTALTFTAQASRVSLRVTLTLTAGAARDGDPIGDLTLCDRGDGGYNEMSLCL